MLTARCSNINTPYRVMNIASVAFSAEKELWSGQQCCVVTISLPTARMHLYHGWPCWRWGRAMRLHNSTSTDAWAQSCSGEGPKAASFCVKACTRDEVATAGRTAVNVLRRSWEQRYRERAGPSWTGKTSNEDVDTVLLVCMGIM